VAVQAAPARLHSTARYHLKQSKVPW
jgi:hypothetical protein